MKAQKLFFVIFVSDLVFGFNLFNTVKYFQIKNLKFVTGYLCNVSAAEELGKKLSDAGMRSNFPSLDEIEISENLWKGLFYPSSPMTGVVIDMTCNYSKTVLEIASENRFFDINRHWLIFVGGYFTQDEFENVALQEEPQMFDPYQYLEEGNDQMTFGNQMRQLSFEANADLLNDPEVIAMIALKNKTNYHPHHKSELLETYVNLKAIVDSEVVLAVPEQDHSFTLFQIHRKSIFTKMLIEKIGSINEDLEIMVPVNVSSVNRRKNFNGTLMRATVALLHRSYYSKNSSLTAKQFDYWAMKNTQTSVLMEEQYNLRLVVKCFDDYGWKLRDGSYTGMLRHFNERKADMTAGGMLLISSRMEAVDYVTNNCKVGMAMFFKQPALSQVTNIFVLPFSRGVWFSVTGLIFIVGFVFYLQIRVTRPFADKESLRIKFPEIFTFLTGAACQQGFDITTNILSARMTMLVFLASALFLFASYNANIVSLLQASSNAIGTIRAFIDSSLGMAVEDLGYERKLIEDDNDPLIRELYNKKLADKQALGKLFIGSKEGMELVRNGFFAFHLEIETGARIIGETYSEAEKCTLKQITLFPNRFNGHVVQKKSPYWEILAQAHRWFTEVGFTQRGLKRFSYSLPQCSNSGGGFNSIGLSDVNYVVIFFAFGIGLSIGCLIAEKIYKHRQKRQNNLLAKHNLQSFFN